MEKEKPLIPIDRFVPADVVTVRGPRFMDRFTMRAVQVALIIKAAFRYPFTGPEVRLDFEKRTVTLARIQRSYK